MDGTEYPEEGGEWEEVEKESHKPTGARVSQVWSLTQLYSVGIFTLKDVCKVGVK